MKKTAVAAAVLFLAIVVAPAYGAAPVKTVKLSSGLFGLPEEAGSVDWMVQNNSASDQVITVTVYKAGFEAAKTVVPPGAITVTLPPGQTIHNANSVGWDQPFPPGAYYEVVLEAASPNVLPSVHVWKGTSNAVIPGTLIPPGSWVVLK